MLREGGGKSNCSGLSSKALASKIDQTIESIVEDQATISRAHRDIRTKLSLIKACLVELSEVEIEENNSNSAESYKIEEL